MVLFHCEGHDINRISKINCGNGFTNEVSETCAYEKYPSNKKEKQTKYVKETVHIQPISQHELSNIESMRSENLHVTIIIIRHTSSGYIIMLNNSYIINVV